MTILDHALRIPCPQTPAARLSAALALLLFFSAINAGRAQVLAFEEAKQRADNGDAFAQAVVALHYQLGWNTERNPELAAKYAIASAEARHPLGLFRLGALMRAGEGVPKDEKQGLALQAAAAEGLNRSNDPYSLTALGILVFQGKAVAQNVPEADRRKEAARLYKLAADTGYAPAQFNYAMCAEAGHGVHQDIGLRDAYLEQAISAKYPPACVHRAESDRQAGRGHIPVEQYAPDIANARLNPDTRVWERASQSGESSDWVSLVRFEPQPSLPLGLAIRAQYSGYPVTFESWPDGKSSRLNISVARQSLVGSSQYSVLCTNNEVSVAPNLRLSDRNLWGLTEYPAAIALKVHNRSDMPVTLDSVVLRVKSWAPINESIPGIVSNDGQSVRVHDFGWWRGDSVGLEMAHCVEFYNGGDMGRMVRAFEPLPRDPETSFPIRFHDGYVAPRDFGYLVVKPMATSPEEPVGSKPLQFYSLDGSPDACVYTEMPADLILPEGRDGYGVRYPVGMELQPGEEHVFTVNLTADRSANIETNIELFTSAGRLAEWKTLKIHVEKLRPPADWTVHRFPPRDGNESSPYRDFQESILLSIGAGSGREEGSLGLSMIEATECFRDYESKGELVGDLGPEQLAKLGKLNALLREILSAEEVETALKPSIFQENEIRGFRPTREAIIAEISPHKDFDLRFSASQVGGEAVGHLELISSDSEATIASRIPWAFDSNAKEISLKAVHAKNASWIAWLISDGEKSRLFVAFPRDSSLCFTLPLVNENAVENIGVDATTDNLVLRFTNDAVMHVKFPGNAIAMLAHMSKLGESSSIAPYREDVDRLARVRLWLPVFPGSGGREVLSGAEHRCTLKAEGASLEAHVEWLGPLLLAVRSGQDWAVWNLATGRIRPPSDAERQQLSSANSRLDLKPDESSGKSAATFKARHEEWKIGCDFDLSTCSSVLYIYQQESGKHISVFPTSEGFYHSRVPVFARVVSLSQDERWLAAVDQSGEEVWIIDLENASIAARAIRSASSRAVCTVVTPNGVYLSGNGEAEGWCLSNGVNSRPLSRMEVRFNRPDEVLKRFDADPRLVKEASRMRDRLLRRSDFRSLEGATLIDIPVVTVNSRAPERTPDRSVTLDFEASSSTAALKELRVFNTGALVKVLALQGTNATPTREVHGQVEVDLASGENHLQLMAVSEEGFTSSLAEKGVYCTAEPDSRRCFIAAVGVSEYQDPRFNLKVASKDAHDMAAALAEKAQHRGYQPEVLVVRNAEVGAELVQRLRAVLSQAGTDDEVVLFFAGHGLLDKDLEYHFARHDTDFDATENIGITFQDLESLVDGIKPLKRTVLFDTCHSGEVEEEDKPQLLAMVGGAAAPDAGSGVQIRGVATRGMKVNELDPKLRHTDFVELESLFPDSRRAKGANILTSSSGSEFSMESDAWQNGLFTYSFLNALKDEKTDSNGDKLVSFSEVAAAVQDKVKTLSGGQQRPITRGVNREVEVVLRSLGPPAEPLPPQPAKKSGVWPL